MTQEEKQLLLADLCARLPYGVKIKFDSIKETVFTISELGYLFDYNHDIIPYLRPMSSMTDEELNQLKELGGSIIFYNSEKNTWSIYSHGPEVYDWLNANHFDYRGLIEKGLAIEAPKDMYNTKN